MSDPESRLPLIDTIPFNLTLVDTPRSAASPVTPFAIDSQVSGLRWAKRYRRRLYLTDAAIIVVTVAVALLVRFGVTEPASVTMSLAQVGSVAAGYWLISLVIITSWILALAVFHTRDSRVIGVGAAEYKQVVNASAVAFGFLAIGFLVFQVDISRGYCILAIPLGVAGLVLSRWIWRKWLMHQRLFGHYLSRVIVVGDQDDVEYVVTQIEEKSGAAYYVVGVALDNATGNSIHPGPNQVPVVADFESVADAVVAFGVDTVIVAGQPGGGSYIRNLGWELERTSAELVLSSRLTDVAGPRIRFRPVEGLPLIHVEIPHFEGTKHVLKRTLDLVAAGVALLLLAPAFVIVGILIRLDSPGPAFFIQERCGRNGKTFRMVKFRSMVTTAESDLEALRAENEGSGVLFKIRNDPRVTRLGRVIRKYSIDEFPQLWNVFIGDMSLVGPRPPLLTEVADYETHVHRRLYIKPGLTGMWQVNGRSNLDWDESVRLDLYYVENWSLLGDLMILWRTVRVLTHPTGAY